jgi:predicted porin
MSTPFSRSSLRLSAVALAALFGALGAAQAQSNVTIYGAIGLDVISASHVYNGTRSGSVVKIDDNAIVNSRVGIKGDEDLGGGLKAIYDLESSINPDTGSARTQFWNRGAYVGLSGGLGTIKFGQQWNVSDDYMCGYFVCAYYSPFLMQGFFALSDYYSNAIKYTSPNFGGVEGGLYYSAGERSGHSSAGQKFQAAVNYTAGPFGIGVVAFSEKDPLGIGTNTMYAVGGSYDFGPAKLRAGLATAEVNYFYTGASGTTPESSTTTGAYKAKLIDLGVDVPITSQFSTALDYVKKDVTDSPDDTYFIRGRAVYALSKRTSLNFNVIYSKNSGGANFAFITEGKGFGGEAGQTQTIITAGITHSF